MTDPFERLVNLALYLASCAHPASAEEIRVNVDGYGSDQDEAAFLRMFERDKESLRDSGLAIEESEGRYLLDADSTFAAPVELSAEDVAVIRVVGAALAEDPAFPFAEDLRLALAKLATTFETSDAPAVTRLAEERAEQQGDAVARLDEAATGRKSVTFGYTNQRGEQRKHAVEPYGLFARDGRWYLVARDIEIDDVRVYAIARVGSLAVNPTRPKSPDFVRPAGFDVADFVRLPFQYGGERIDAVVRIAPEHAWRAESLTGGVGTLEPAADATMWRVVANDPDRLLRWIVENGPGLALAGPETLVARVRDALARVEATHG